MSAFPAVLLLSSSSLLLLSLPPPSCGVSFGPSFVQEPPRTVLLSGDDGGVVDCLATGEPEPIVDWVDDDGEVLPFLTSTARWVPNSLY